MNNYRFYLLSLLLVITSVPTSCKKGKSTLTIKGGVLNESTNQMIPQSNLNLYEIEASTGIENLIGSTTTDDQGNFTITFPRNQVDSYILRGTKTNYFDFEKIIPFSDLSVKKDNYIYGLTSEKAWVKLRFENINPQPNETLQYNVNKVKTDCIECCSKGMHTIANVIDTTIYCINDGNKEFEYYYSNNLTGESGFKTVITTSFDTTEIHLIY